MELRRPRGHEELVERLWAAAAAGRLPHAFSFEGPAGTGKFVAMRWFAAGLLCERGPGEPCLGCGPCKRVLSGGPGGNHPDLLVVDPVEEGEEQIRIGRIAERAGSGAGGPDSVAEFLSLRTMEGGLRPVLIREAHRMNAAAQNALLKTLEEPRPGTLLCLETHRPDRLLPTIRSRCLRVRTRSLESGTAVEVLVESGLERARAERLVALAPGSPGEALACERGGAEPLLELCAELLRGRRPPLAAAAAVWELEADFPGPTPAVRARARARFAISRMAALAGDALRACEGLSPAVPAHGELAAGLQEGGGAGSPAAWARAAEALVACRGDVDRNLAPEAVLERAFLVLAEAAGLCSGAAGGTTRPAAGREA